MSTSIINISQTRIFLAGLHETNINWIKIRALISLLENDIPEASAKWSKFKFKIVPLFTVQNMALMGSASKADNVPDETITRIAPAVQPASVFDLYKSALDEGFTLNPEKVWIPTNIDPQIYDEELTQAIGNWFALAELYVKVVDCLYVIGLLKAFCGPKSDLIEEVILNGIKIARTPGQAIQMFPNTNSYLLENSWTHFDSYRVFNSFSIEYFYWLSRSESNYVQNDPPFEFDIIVDETPSFEVLDDGIVVDPWADPEEHRTLTFRFKTEDQSGFEEDDIFIGMNFASKTIAADPLVQLPMLNPLMSSDYSKYEWLYERDMLNEYKIIMSPPEEQDGEEDSEGHIANPWDPAAWIPTSFANIALAIRITKDNR